jgi:uncharacterized membrane protein YgaE (UPF0421/DUF939 family)
VRVTLPAVVRRTRDQVRLADRLYGGVGRVRSSWWGIGQSAVGGALAWEVAVRLLDHPAPFFASVAAIVSLSISHLGRLRRVVEISIGVTVGVLVGDVVVHQIGRGAWQLGVVVLIAMAAALLLDGGMLIVTQAALQAVFVTALPPPTEGYFGRWEDALVGGAVALAVAFALPPDPRTGPRREASVVVHSVARALRESAAAARAGDVDGAHAALELARATEPELVAWREAVSAGEEISRISPLRRRARPEILTHQRAVLPIDRAVRNIRVALRRMVAAVEDAGADAGGEAGARRPAVTPRPAGVEVGEPLLACIEDLAGALYTLPGALRDPDGEGGRRTAVALRDLAGRLDPERLASSLSTTVVVAQLRSAVVDLLQVAGLTESQARAVLPR